MFIQYFILFNVLSVLGYYQETESCSSINKHLRSYVTWTDQLVNSQHKGKVELIIELLIKT